MCFLIAGASVVRVAMSSVNACSMTIDQNDQPWWGGYSRAKSSFLLFNGSYSNVWSLTKQYVISVRYSLANAQTDSVSCEL